jgi:prepilin-type N-terminal cleavage/methylation domain-containing protein
MRDPNIKVGFTLAEVLITLLIIGVISSIVIPGLIQDSQQAELRTAWKKTYFGLDQATKRIMMDNGGTLKGLCTSDFNRCYRDKYLPYFNYVKTCDDSNTQGNCWVYHDDMKQLNGNSIPSYWGIDSPSVILNNGSSILFFGFEVPDCSMDNWGKPQGKTVCGYLFVDVNGLKNPNTIGKDIYGAFVLENTILPVGTQGDNYSPSSNCTSSATGEGCSAKYLYQ